MAYRDKSKFLETRALLPLLELQLEVSVGEREDPQLAVRPGGALRDDVRQQDGEPAVVVQPPHVQGAGFLYTTKSIE